MAHIRIKTKKEKNSTFPHFFPKSAHKCSTFLAISTILPYGKTSVTWIVTPGLLAGELVVKKGKGT
jgi:hypothetical protein